MKLMICAAASALTLVALPATATAQSDTAYQEALAAYQAAQSAWDGGQKIYEHWNAQRRGWTTTESGLQYRRVGRAQKNAPQPAETDTVMVHYAGTLINGTEFDSSYKRNEPTSFPLNRVIKGWTEGVALMREGETFEFVIPAELAYGARRMGNDIPANSTLLFTVELLKVNP
ncbi:FKBP-type peptidyl-prolyl cis-trans isomerase [Brevundimonas sp.]|uniref:FKBP-type peptidyl-prolyl cis-trans isomerase n=1 Tax=Brevundimonas sp. TaxID=1871086 RepID=UPI0028A19C56|nr:FKBP-type peptidyl-prolyl cis-trans isomerase [Brevundimonas sp.]